MMKIFRRIPMPVFLFFLIAITACEKAKPNSIEVVMTAPSTPQPMINRVSSKIVASSFNELIYYSDLIVKGRVVSQEGLINTARNPSDLSEPDLRFYSINQVYKIEAENVLKGEATNTFLVVQNQGLISIPSDGTPTIAEIEDEIKNPENGFTNNCDNSYPSPYP